MDFNGSGASVDIDCHLRACVVRAVVVEGLTARDRAIERILTEYDRRLSPREKSDGDFTCLLEA